jgi:hypothetical protein
MKTRIEDISAILWFLYGSSIANEYWMGHRARDIFDAACRLTDIPPDEMWKKIDDDWHKSIIKESDDGQENIH